MTQEQKNKSIALTRSQINVGIIIVAFMFFIFGFTSWVNAILIPYFKLGFQLTHFQSYLVTFAFYITYLIFSIPSSYLLKRVGFKTGMMIGFWIMAIGALMFVPAAHGMKYGIFLAGLFTIGAGLSILQSAANPYVTLLGDPARATQRFSIMGICNKSAGILAPLIFAAFIFKATDSTMMDQLNFFPPDQRKEYLSELVSRVIVPYSVLSAILFAFGLFLKFSNLPDIDESVSNPISAEQQKRPKSIMDFPHLVLGVIALFFHVGTQIISIDTIISYANSMGLNLMEAKTFPSFTLGATIVSYLIGIVLVPKFVSPLRMLQICVVGGMLFSIIILTWQKQVTWLGYELDISIWFLAMLGLFNGLVWPGIWSLALKGLGSFTKVGGAFMVTGLVGNALMPLLYGFVADKLGDRNGYLVLLPCYGFLIYYATYGYSVTSWKLGANKIFQTSKGIQNG